MMRFIVAACLIAVSSAEAFAGVSSIANLRDLHKKARERGMAVMMKQVHDGYDSPLWLTRVELKKDSPDWDVLAKQARAFAAMVEIMTPPFSEMTYTARSRYWYATYYIEATNSLGKAIEKKDLKDSRSSLGNVLNSCCSCHGYRLSKFARDLSDLKLIQNKAKDISIATQREEETIVEFFQRHRVAVAQVSTADLKVLAEGKRIDKETFVDGTSTNDDPPEVLFGSFVRIAAPPEAMARLFAKHLTEKPDSYLSVLFVPDPRDDKLFHPIGVTTRGPWSFFNPKAKRSPGDDFTPADLIRKKPK